MDVPRELVALRLKTGGLTIAVVLPWILGGALPLPKQLRTACLGSALTASIAGIVTSRRLIREEGYYQARLDMYNESFQSELAYQTAALENELEAVYLSSEPLNVHEPEHLNHTSSQGVQRFEPSVNLSEPSVNLPVNLSEPPPIADPFSSAIDPGIRGLVVEMRRQRISQDEIIFKVWGCPKGGTEKYKAALAKYRQIISDAGLN